jgi:hypothetical protein
MKLNVRRWKEELIKDYELALVQWQIQMQLRELIYIFLGYRKIGKFHKHFSPISARKVLAIKKLRSASNSVSSTFTNCITN